MSRGGGRNGRAGLIALGLLSLSAGALDLCPIGSLAALIGERERRRAARGARAARSAAGRRRRVGAALGASGAILQAVARNLLADPRHPRQRSYSRSNRVC
ncbi:MAG: iron chelate uptake ABC transporter family permease subunit [Rhodobacteraceae bacterium]|nr:iron chelate uptake ABC transporter family permease subunit [Paracoccaceae bacterium]